MASNDKIANKLAGLAALSRDELAVRWTASFGCPPPRGVRRELLLQACAFHIQVRHVGGLTVETKRLLKRAVTRVSARIATTSTSASDEQHERLQPNSLPASGALQPTERRTLSPGGRLLRDWQGVTYVVDVVEGGFLFNGSLHRSLSAIAKQITGAHWSGPRFFGL